MVVLNVEQVTVCMLTDLKKKQTSEHLFINREITIYGMSSHFEMTSILNSGLGKFVQLSESELWLEGTFSLGWPGWKSEILSSEL